MNSYETMNIKYTDSDNFSMLYSPICLIFYNNYTSCVEHQKLSVNQRRHVFKNRRCNFPHCSGRVGLPDGLVNGRPDGLVNGLPDGLERFPFVWKNRLFRWEIKWNGPFHWKFFGKKGIPSEVFLFSRFSRNDRKISVPFATTSLFAHRARSTSDPKNVETYPFNRFKLIQNSCRV